MFSCPTCNASMPEFCKCHDEKEVFVVVQTYVGVFSYESKADAIEYALALRRQGFGSEVITDKEYRARGQNQQDLTKI